MTSPVEMPVGASVVNTMGDVEATTTRTGVDSVELVFRSKVSQEIVLATKGTSAGPTLDPSTIDTVFWNITINGQPATQAQWSKVTQPGSNITINADPATRQLSVVLGG